MLAMASLVMVVMITRLSSRLSQTLTSLYGDDSLAGRRNEHSREERQTLVMEAGERIIAEQGLQGLTKPVARSV
jgi:hypothetical protein